MCVPYGTQAFGPIATFEIAPDSSHAVVQFVHPAGAEAVRWMRVGLVWGQLGC